MQSIIDNFLDLIPLSSYVEISFGILFSFILFYIDRNSKIRQEKSLNRQDESLDIILDQVSKVNLFQTKTLSLAIESLGNDLEGFKKDLNTLRHLMIDKDLDSDETNRFSKDILKNDLDESPILSTNFSQILGSQIQSFASQIKNGLSDIDNVKNKTEKDYYKFKKTLQSDVKDLLNIEELLSDLTSEKSILNDKSPNLNNHAKNPKKDIIDKSSHIIDNLLKDKESKYQFKKTTRGSVSKNDFKDLSVQLGKLKSIPELVKFTENVLNLVDISNKDKNRNKQVKKDKHRRVQPSSSLKPTDDP